MNETRISLLRRVQHGSEGAWRELTGLYQPLIQGWFERHGVARHDAEELSQDVMAILVRSVPDFVHSGQSGSFRSWLRVITANRAKEFWRSSSIRPKAKGGSTYRTVVEQLEDEKSDLAKAWDEEHDQYLLRGLLQLVSSEFEPVTMTIFNRLVIDGERSEELANELNMTVGAVYSAKSRVLRRPAARGAGNRRHLGFLVAESRASRITRMNTLP